MFENNPGDIFFGIAAIVGLAFIVVVVIFGIQHTSEEKNMKKHRERKTRR